jgi:hypothetical protein
MAASPASTGTPVTGSLKRPGNISPIPAGTVHFLALTDDFTGYVWVYLYKEKCQFLSCLKDFKALVENQRKDGLKIQRVRMDGAKEFSSHEAEAFLKEADIIIEPSAPYRHQQNGKAERTNRTLIDMGRTMLVDAGLPEAFWAEAIRYAVYLKNRLPSKSCPAGMLSPYEAFYENRLQLQSIHPFGCAVYIEIPRELRRKVLSQPKAKPAIFIGCIEGTTHQFRLYDTVKRTVVVDRDVSLIDLKRPAKKDREPLQWDADEILAPQLELVPTVASGPLDMEEPAVPTESPELEFNTEPSTVEPDLNAGESTSDSDYLSDVSDRLDAQQLTAPQPAPVQCDRRSIRLEKQPSRHWDFKRHGKDFVRFSKAENRFLGCSTSTAFTALRTDSSTVPQSAKEARRSSQAKQWEDAMAAELQACKDMHIWERIPYDQQSSTVKAKKHLRNQG